jgi:hypothetical protein
MILSLFVFACLFGRLVLRTFLFELFFQPVTFLSEPFKLLISFPLFHSVFFFGTVKRMAATAARVSEQRL